MAWQISYITVVIMISRVFYITNHECGTDIYSFYQMMLKGHTFKSFPIRPGSLDCREACLADSRCQSYNVVFKGICELNNRTREARPENFVRNQERYYTKKSSNIGMTFAHGKNIILNTIFSRIVFNNQSLVISHTLRKGFSLKKERVKGHQGIRSLRSFSYC